MEHHFKADLNGWLEYESKRPTMHTKIFKHRKLSIDDYDSVPTELLESFASTLTYYDYSLDARKALHATVFHAVMNNKNYATDFDIPRFETGVDHRILHHVSSRFDLHAYTIRALGRMSTQDALEFIDTTFKQTMKPLRYFHTTFVRLMHREAPLDLDYTRFNGWLAFQFQIDHDIQHHLESVIEVIYECILNNETKARQDPSIQFKTSASTNRLYDMMERLMDAISSKECFSDTTVNYIALISQWAGKPSRLCRIDSTCVPVKTCQDVRKRQSSIQHTYHALSKHRDTLDCHQQAFLAICHHLHQATGSIVNVSNQTSDFVPLQKVILAEISQVTQQVYGSYLEWKLVCCQAIDKRTRGWLSFLKLMVQFADLWLVDLERSGCMHVFVSLVVQYHLMPVLVDKVSASNKGIKSLYSLLYQCMESSPIEALLDLLDYTTQKHVTIRQDVSRELQKIGNQITYVEENEGLSDDIVKKVMMLAILSPHETMNKLIELCLKNKHQYKAILPMLKQLQLPFKSIIWETCYAMFRAGENPLNENTFQFIKACCEPSDQHLPAVLTSDETTWSLIDIKELLTEICLGIESHLYSGVEKESHIEHNVFMTRLYLTLFDACCQSFEAKPMVWTEQALETVLKDIPVVLHCPLHTFALGLVRFLNERHESKDNNIQQFKQQLVLQDWELALSCFEKVLVLIRYGIQKNIYTNNSLDEPKDWQSRMLLFPLIKKPFKVPSSLIHLTGELHGTFEKQDDYGHTNGLYSLFLACKLSPRMTDRLFQYASEWTHNTLFLYKHPFEASFVQRLLEHVLHPQHYSSVSTEYPHLLQHFLGQLYDSFDCYTLLRDYEHYEPQASLLPIIQKLNQQDMRLFYSVLYTVQLLKNQKKECLDKEDRYYATSLIKVLQGLKNWHQLSHSGRYVSYAALRKTVKSLSASELYYPLLITPDSISERALSVLTLFYMCLACDKKDPFVYDSLKRFILQIMEGLIDNPSRQQFAKMVQQQPKSRITHWKKKSKSGDYVATMKIRPLFVPEEQALLSPVFIQDLFQTQLTQQKDTLYFI